MYGTGFFVDTQIWNLGGCRYLRNFFVILQRLANASGNSEIQCANRTSLGVSLISDSHKASFWQLSKLICVLLSLIYISNYIFQIFGLNIQLNRVFTFEAWLKPVILELCLVRKITAIRFLEGMCQDLSRGQSPVINPDEVDQMVIDSIGGVPVISRSDTPHLSGRTTPSVLSGRNTPASNRAGSSERPRQFQQTIDGVCRYFLKVRTSFSIANTGF
jgi:hypothetical protein